MNIQKIFQDYKDSPGVNLGTLRHENTLFDDTRIVLPFCTLNRHGLIAGATGTGKTKSLQRFLEELSSNGIPSLVMDMKGDLSGVAAQGSMNEKIQKRIEETKSSWSPKKFPVEFLTLNGEDGAKLRATVTEFGPLLFAKILDLNETQSSVLSVIFTFADERALPLLDLQDVKTLIRYIQEEGKEEFEAQYGRVSTATTGIILRNIVELEGQGADIFFGERSFDVLDLLQRDTEGKGIIHIIRLLSLQEYPKLFSTFMLQLLSEVFSKFPEVGDLEKPKLMICIDEAHLIFKNASKTLLDHLEMVIKLIRSKGVGIVFITQSPEDIPASVLGQLGFRIQHALRAFTAKDRIAMGLVAKNFPESTLYNVEPLLTELGIGEALVTGLSEKGTLLPLAHVVVTPPESRMDILSAEELQACLSKSFLATKYAEPLDLDSAHELLMKKMQEQSTLPSEEEKNTVASFLEHPLAKTMIRTATSSVVRNLTGQVTRGLLGALMKGIMGKR